MTSLALYPSLFSLVPTACALFFYLFCGQSRNCELIISGSIAGFSGAPSLGGSIGEGQWHYGGTECAEGEARRAR